MTHLSFALFTALMLSFAMAATERRSPRERFAAAAATFFRCMAFTVAGGWLMFWVHG